MARKTILVTGGAGFIGSAFVRRLFAQYPDYHLIVLDALTYAGNPRNFPEALKSSERFEFWYGNILNMSLVDTLMSRANIVVHFAAETHVSRSIFDDRVFFETDVLGTQTLANAALKYRKNIERFIHISTSEVYGDALHGEQMDENHPLNPPSPYAAAKAGADRLVYSYHLCYDFPCVIVRPFNNYGPYQHLEKVVPRFITNALDDEPLTVHGSGDAKRDWIFVEDNIDAIDAIMHADLDVVRGQVFNVSGAESISVLAIAQAVVKMLGKSDELITYMADRPGQINHIADTTKIRETLKFAPKTKFADGLAATIDWYKTNDDWYRPLMWMRHVKIRNVDGTTAVY